MERLVGGRDGSGSCARDGVRVSLEHAGERWTLQDTLLWDTAAGASVFAKHLAAASQPFDMVAEQCLGWADWPWLPMLVSTTVCVQCRVAAAAAFVQQRRQRERADLLRQIDRVSRFGMPWANWPPVMAHELNQPLTAGSPTRRRQRACCANRPDLSAAQPAMTRAAEQARRAADVLARLRQTVSQPDAAVAIATVNLADAARKALFLIEPECAALGGHYMRWRHRRQRHCGGSRPGAGVAQPARQCADSTGQRARRQTITATMSAGPLAMP